MGSYLLSTDMLVNDYIKPMNQAYSFHQYETASHLLWQLLKFFDGFGYEIEDMPKPIATGRECRQRINCESTFKAYFESHAPDATKLLGIYQREVLDKIKLDREMGGLIA